MMIGKIRHYLKISWWVQETGELTSLDWKMPSRMPSGQFIIGMEWLKKCAKFFGIPKSQRSLQILVIQEEFTSL